MTESGKLDCDLLVVGSGAAGLSAAVTAAHLGLDVIVIEKEPQLGGTTAWSGGWLWIPRNPLAKAAGIDEDIEGPRSYLRHELGNGYDESMVAMFLEQGPRMVSFFQNETDLDFIDGNSIPDFHHPAPGAAPGGRSVCAAPFDARKLGNRVRDLKPPLQAASPFGMGIASGTELRHFLNATYALPSFLHVVKRVARHVRDLLVHKRGMHLVNGNALVARLLKSADAAGVRVLISTPARELILENGRVAGVRSGETIAIRARRGVVLATGGFPHDVERKAKSFPHAPTGREHWSAAPEGNTGDGIRLAETAGGRQRQDLSDAGAWAPVSLAPERNGTVTRFPHLIERAKPGLIMVRSNGRRFVNEADSYHDVIKALLAATPSGETVQAWTICDRAFLRHYGLGRVRPRPFPIGPWLRNKYLFQGVTIAQLANACGIDSKGLTATVDAYNGHAIDGNDPEFHRGDSAYNRMQGDSAHAPNFCVAPIVRGPFYAVRIVPGSLGTFSGIRTDAYARVLDARLQPIEGLYAVGNDMSSIMAGRYPAGGITLGPAMTFGYVAAHHASGVPLDTDRTAPNSTGERHAL